MFTFQTFWWFFVYNTNGWKVTFTSNWKFLPQTNFEKLVKRLFDDIASFAHISNVILLFHENTSILRNILIFLRYHFGFRKRMCFDNVDDTYRVVQKSFEIKMYMLIEHLSSTTCIYHTTISLCSFRKIHIFPHSKCQYGLVRYDLFYGLFWICFKNKSGLVCMADGRGRYKKYQWEMFELALN